MPDAGAFEAFVRAHQDMVYATAVRLLGRPAEAEDIAQTVFLKAFQRFEALETSPAAAGWLKTVTTNLCLNHLARYRRRWTLFSDLAPTPAGEPAALADAALPADSVAAAIDTRERNARLEQALRELPAHQRVPIVLFHFDEMSYEAIAERLRVSLSKVKVDIHRGRLALRAALESGTRRDR
jgi:RNA polymerase sigma-70 factor (ECF subfamily)